MEEKKQLLAQRNKMNKGRSFVVKESKFCAGVKRRWRYPRGKHSAVRQEHKGRPLLPSVGCGAPRLVKGLHPNGLRPIVISSQKGLLSLDPAQDGAVLSGKIGNKRKKELLQLANEKRIIILGVKDAAVLAKKIEDDFQARKKLRAEKLQDKSKKEAEKAKKAEEKKKKEEEEKKKAEKEAEKSAEGEVSEAKKDEKSAEEKMIQQTLTKRQ